MLTYNPEADPMPENLIDRMLNAVHTELDHKPQV